MRLNSPKPRRTTHEGATVSHLSPTEMLRRSVTACLLWEKQFYEDGVEIADRIERLMPLVSPEACQTLAIEAREQMHLRHVPLLLVCAMASHPTHRHLVADTAARVIQRADELTELLAIYSRGRTGTKRLGKLSKQLQKGLARAFPKFDAYQLAKYDRGGEIRLRDALFVSHAKPKDAEQAATWRQLIDGKLPAPDTWEVALSSGADKRESWERLLREKRLGGLALLRNLRNMVQAKVPFDVIAAGIAECSFRRILPFRFIAAARHAPALEPALEVAMLRAAAELPKLPGRTVLIVDHSGSMSARLSAKSDMSRFDAAAALAVLARETCEQLRVIAFSREPAEIPARRGFALRDAIASSMPALGTYTGKSVQLANEMGYDRCLVVTDGQSHDTIPAPHGQGVIVNMASYDRGIGYGPWTVIHGWSESILSYAAEVDRTAPPRAGGEAKPTSRGASR